MWRKELELAVHQGKELLLERRLPEPRVVAHGRNRMVDLLLEEVQRDVFLRREVIEQGAFRDPGPARDGLRRRRLKASHLKEREGRGDDALLGCGFLALPAGA